LTEDSHPNAASPIRIGFIGAGGMAQVSHIPNLRATPDVVLAAICDENIARAASIAERYHIETWSDDPEEMLKQTPLDCVIITTPTITHLPLCQLALESGVDVMVEKPFARSGEEAWRMVRSAEENQRLVMAGMNHRFREDVLMLKETLEREELGEIYMIASGWLRRLGVWGRPYWFTDKNLAGGGVLMDLGLQMIDMALWMMDFPAVVESACGCSHKLLELDVEDSATVFMRFDNEATFLLEVSWANCAVRDIAYTFFSGSQGRAALNPLRLNRRQKDRVVAETPPQLGDDVELYRRSYMAEARHFIDCVRERTQPLSSGVEAAQVLQVVDQLYRSAGD